MRLLELTILAEQVCRVTEIIKHYCNLILKQNINDLNISTEKISELYTN